MSEVFLSPHEARVVACLVEKSITTPAYYPMTANGLMAAANQKSSRNPVLNLTEGEVGQALLTLEEKGFAARDDLSARVTKWRHKLQHQLLLKKEPLAVLVALMLRGPQTLAELRANALALGGADHNEGIQLALEDLHDRAQPLAIQLPRVTGQAATRWAHLLSGEPENVVENANAGQSSEKIQLIARVNDLEQRIKILEQKLAALTLN